MFLLGAIVQQAAAAPASPALSVYEQWSLVWYAVSACAAAAGLIVVSLAALFTYHQIREASKSRQVESILAILHYIDDPELRAARQLIHDPSFVSEVARLESTWSEAAMEELVRTASRGQATWQGVRRSLGSIENISMLVMYDLTHDEVVNMFFARTIALHWTVMQPVIQSLRRYYGGSEFLQHLEMLNRFIAADGFALRAWQRSRLKRLLLREHLERRSRSIVAPTSSDATSGQRAQ
jgi:hypothetical protein